MKTLRQTAFSVVLFALLAVCFASLASAQTATLTGRVTDATDAVIPGTRITVTNVATGASRAVETNELGYYTVPLLPPGSYSVTAEQAGFKAITRDGVILQVDQRAELNLVLEVGEITERIEVTAAVVQLNTVDASRGQVIENQRIVDMPLNGRDYTQLALLSAGTVQPVGGRYEGFSSGGMRTTQNNFLLDGIDNNAIELAGAQRRSEMVQPSIDSIQEFKVQTNAYAAEYGRSMGSVVNVTTKSGTNELHGSAYEFLRNEKLDAKNFFDPADKPKPPFKRNQYGFSLGGPLLIPKVFNGRNRVFWFGDYEGTRIRESSTTTSTIPTARMRSGDFSDLLTYSNKAITDPTTKKPFPGNIIPSDRIDPVALRLIQLYPEPQKPGLASKYQGPVKQDVDKWSARADVNLGAGDNAYWRITVHDLANPVALALPPPAYGGGAYDWITQGINTGAGWNRVWSPNVIMSVRAGWNFALFKRDNPAQAAGELLNKKYGIPGGNDTIPGGFSSMGITGYRAVGIGGFNPVDRDSQNRQIIGDVTWIKGSHTVKMGASFLRSQNNIFNIRNEIGSYSFNGRYTADGAADFMLGMASQYGWNTRLQVQLRSWNQGYFIQDDWKVTPKLTLNLGVRYELVLPFVDKYDRMGIFDLTTDPNKPRLIYAGSEGTGSYNRAMYRSDKDNIMPRFGIAYKLNDKTVIRTGYGIYYSYLEPFGDAEYLIGNPPNAYGVTITSSATVPAVLLRSGPPPGALELAKATGLTFVSYEREPDTDQGQQWNFNIQRELGQDWLLEVGYSGSKGTHLLRRVDANFSPPGPGNINAKRRYQSAEIPGTGIVSSPLGPVQGYAHNANSNYHALITRLEKRFSGGFTLLTSYGFSKAIGDVCGAAAQGDTSGCGHQDLRNIRLDRSVDNQDVPHRFVASGIWELPFGKGRKWGANWPGFANAILGGWSTGNIVVISSGRPYNAIVSGNPANTGTIGVVNRPNLNGDPYDWERTLARDFNIGVFTPNNQYEIGSAGRNILRQRGFFNWDFSLMKNFQIKESFRAQFRFEGFHFSNTPRFGQAGNTLGTATFGLISGAGTPRNLQFGLKLIW